MEYRTIMFKESNFAEALDRALNGGSFRVEATNAVVRLVADFILKEAPDKIYLNFRTNLSSSILRTHLNAIMPEIRRAMTLLGNFCGVQIMMHSYIEEAKKLISEEYREVEYVSRRRKSTD